MIVGRGEGAVLVSATCVDTLDTDISGMMFYLTIGSTYFVKTRTYVALFCPHELSIIFSGVMCLELCPL